MNSLIKKAIDNNDINFIFSCSKYDFAFDKCFIFYALKKGRGQILSLLLASKNTINNMRICDFTRLFADIANTKDKNMAIELMNLFNFTVEDISSKYEKKYCNFVRENGSKYKNAYPDLFKKLDKESEELFLKSLEQNVNNAEELFKSTKLYSIIKDNISARQKLFKIILKIM